MNEQQNIPYNGYSNVIPFPQQAHPLITAHSAFAPPVDPVDQAISALTKQRDQNNHLSILHMQNIGREQERYKAEAEQRQAAIRAANAKVLAGTIDHLASIIVENEDASVVTDAILIRATLQIALNDPDLLADTTRLVHLIPSYLLQQRQG